jgi:hypothetical protein
VRRDRPFAHRRLFALRRAAAVRAVAACATFGPAAACRDATPTGPRDARTPEGALFSAHVDRPEIAVGEVATVTFRLVNTRDTAITLPAFRDCALEWDTQNAAGRDVSWGCAAAGPALRVAARDSVSVSIPFTGREVWPDGSTHDYPAGRYAVRGLLGPRNVYDPYEVLTSSSPAFIRIR